MNTTPDGLHHESESWEDKTSGRGDRLRLDPGCFFFRDISLLVLSICLKSQYTHSYSYFFLNSQGPYCKVINISFVFKTIERISFKMIRTTRNSNSMKKVMHKIY